MSVFGARGDKQWIAVGYSFFDSAYSAEVGQRVLLYLRIRRYVWRSFKGRLGTLYRNGALVSRATRNMLAKSSGSSLDTVDRTITWLENEGWLQRIDLKGKTYLTLGKWAKGSKTGKIRELYLSDQVIQARIQAEQAQTAAADVADLVASDDAVPPPQKCGLESSSDSGTKPQKCGLGSRKNAASIAAKMRLMNIEEKNREPEDPNLPYGKGAALRAPLFPEGRAVPSAVSLSARSASGAGEGKTSPEKESTSNDSTSRTTAEVSKVTEHVVCVAQPVESPPEEIAVAETPEQKKIREAEKKALQQGSRTKAVPAPDEPTRSARKDAYGDDRPQPARAQKEVAKEKRRAAIRAAYDRIEVPDPDKTDRTPGDTLGLAKFFAKAVQKANPFAAIRPGQVDLTWCKQLLQEYATNELYEMIMVLVLDWPNIQQSKKFFPPPGGATPTIADFFKWRAVLATYIGKGFTDGPTARMSAYLASFTKRSGDPGSVFTGEVEMEDAQEEKLKRIEAKLRKQAGE